MALLDKRLFYAYDQAMALPGTIVLWGALATLSVLAAPSALPDGLRRSR